MKKYGMLPPDRVSEDMHLLGQQVPEGLFEYFVCVFVLYLTTHQP